MFKMDAPAALVPALTTRRPNQSLLLYKGSALLEDARGRTSNSQVCVRLRWLPSPRLELEAADVAFPFGMGEGKRDKDGRVGYSVDFSSAISVTVPSVPTGVAALLTGMGATVTAVLIEAAEAGPLQGFEHVLFHLPNFPEYHGGMVMQANASRQSHWSGRAAWECAGWRVTLDSVMGAGDLHKKMKQRGGYAITHVGRLERTDGSPFAASVTNAALETLSFMFSFIRGAWTSCMCPVAFSDGEVRWARWDDPRVSAGSGMSWFSYLHPQSIGIIAPGFFARAAQPHWWEALKLALNWYFEANEHPGMIHSAVVLEQNALETLAWTMFVEDGPVSDSGFENMPAADRIRLMLARASIPMHVPASLGTLASVAKKRKWKDGPQALTDIRNAIIHPKKRRSVGEVPSHALVECWQLGLWYLDLIFLWLFGYSGEYQNRLDPHPMVGKVESVPWAKQP